MKFRAIVEYEYPIEHKLPVKAELILHGDRVVTDNIKWVEQEPTIKNDLSSGLEKKLERTRKGFWRVGLYIKSRSIKADAR